MDQGEALLIMGLNVVYRPRIGEHWNSTFALQSSGHNATRNDALFV
jgi:hypothetical protein